MFMLCILYSLASVVGGRSSQCVEILDLVAFARLEIPRYTLIGIARKL